MSIISSGWMSALHGNGILLRLEQVVPPAEGETEGEAAGGR